MQIEEYGDMLFQSIRKEPNQNFGKKENGIAFSHTEEPVMMNKINMAFEEGQERGEEKTLKSVQDEEGLRVFGSLEFPDFDYLDACVDTEEDM